jgi:hypothetical protein
MNCITTIVALANGGTVAKKRAANLDSKHPGNVKRSEHATTRRDMQSSLVAEVIATLNDSNVPIADQSKLESQLNVRLHSLVSTFMNQAYTRGFVAASNAPPFKRNPPQ